MKVRKAFYIRSAYRNESAFALESLVRTDDALDNTIRPHKLIDSDARVSDNYRRLVSQTVSTMYDGRFHNTPSGEVADLIIGEIRMVLRSIFPDLVLEGPGDPLVQGTFYFTKGSATGYSYQNLSGGEKAALDLILDMCIKRTSFNDTVFCIDEPELHVNPNVHGHVLQELVSLLPGPNCQLWIATHSAGMLKKAFDLYEPEPNDVVFLDFHDRDFDTPQTMSPARVNRTLWKRALSVAAHDFSALVAPSQIVMCEGRALGTAGRSDRAEFDAKVYRIVFGDAYPDTEFISVGGCQEMRELSMLTANLERLFQTMNIIKVSDHDNLSPEEIAALPKGHKVLSRYSIENYLWCDEILVKMFRIHAPSLDAGIILRTKRSFSDAEYHLEPLRGENVSKVVDMHAELKRHPEFRAKGGTAEAFAKHVLAPLITQETEAYKDLERDIFG